MPTKKEYHSNKEYYLKYRKENKEYYENYIKSYDKEKRYKSKKKSEWKCSYKMKGDLDQVYEYYKNATNCYYCNVKLTEEKKLTSTRKCMEHNHTTGYYRCISCHACNCKMRIIDNNFTKMISSLKSIPMLL